MRSRRGGFLTAMAILLALTVIVDVLKGFTEPSPPGHKLMGLNMPPTGIVFLGVRHTGPGATILGLLLGAFLFFYAVGIWRMKRYAMTIAWIYATYVIVNVTLFAIRNPLPPTPGAMVFAIVYMIAAILLTVAAAIALTRRGTDLS
jgi:hypothetical protein